MAELETIAALRRAIHREIVGKDDVIDLLLTCLLARGHVLIEDVPGVGKTSLAAALAQSIAGSFQRIQFTSDLLPSDIIGVPIFNNETHRFEFHPGPVFSNIVLADEINRTTPKTQSALLEAMQECQVTVDRETHALEQPFMVIATQNPIEHFGTYPLPESQLDRFLFKLRLGYPTLEEELRIAGEKTLSKASSRLAPVCTTADILTLQEAVAQVRVEDSLKTYVVDLVRLTRQWQDISLGVSPRGTIALYRASQAYAFVNGRNYVIPDDVKRLAAPVLAHRIIPGTQELSRASLEDTTQWQENLISHILEAVAVPM